MKFYDIPKWISSMEDQVEHLSSLPIDELRAWITEALNKRPHPILTGDEDFHHYFVTLYSYFSPSMQERVKQSIATLIRDFAPAYHDTEYLYYLIYFAGKFRITAAYNQILSWIYKGRLKNVFAPDFNRLTGKDLHLHCLMALGAQALPNDEILRKSCIRDIETDRSPEYFGICYRILYSNYSNSSEYLTKYFSKFVSYCMKGKISFYESFYFIHKNPNTRRVFLQHAERLLKNLTDEQQEFILKAMFSGSYDNETNIRDAGTICDLFNHGTLDLNVLSRIEDYDSFISHFICFLQRWLADQKNKFYVKNQLKLFEEMDGYQIHIEQSKVVEFYAGS